MDNELDISDPKVIEALKVLQHEEKYNTRLKNFLDIAYPWQKQIANLTSDYSVIGCIASNQTGKTETVCAIVCMHLLGEYPKWYTGKKYLETPPTVVMAGVNSNHNRIVLQEKMFGTANRNIESDVGTGMIPLDRIAENSIIKSRDGGIVGCQVTHKSGKNSILEFRAYEQGREAIQGFPADIIVIDEQPKDDFWSEALVRTSARQGIVLCAFTPLKGMTSLVEKFWTLPDDPKGKEDSEGCKLRTDKVSRWAMIRSTWDDIDHITEESKVSQKAGMLDFEIKTRTMGIPMSGEGRIYPHSINDITFDDETSIPITSEGLIGIDFGFTRDPAAAVLAKYDPKQDIVWIIDEFKENIGNLREHCQGIWKLDPYVPVAWPRDGNNYGDFKGGASTAATMRDEFGVLLLPSPFLNPIGPNNIKNNHLAPGFVEINSRFGDGRLKIHTRCEKLIHEINNYSYDSNGKPMKGSEDHLCDAFRYAVMSIIQRLGDVSNSKGKFWYDEVNDGDDDFHFNSY